MFVLGIVVGLAVFTVCAFAWCFSRTSAPTFRERVTIAWQSVLGRSTIELRDIDEARRDGVASSPPAEIADALAELVRAKRQAESALRRAKDGARKRVIDVTREIDVERERALAAEDEIARVAAFLEALDDHGLLDAYLAKRRAQAQGIGAVHRIPRDPKSLS